MFIYISVYTYSPDIGKITKSNINQQKRSPIGSNKNRFHSLPKKILNKSPFYIYTIFVWSVNAYPEIGRGMVGVNRDVSMNCAGNNTAIYVIKWNIAENALADHSHGCFLDFFFWFGFVLYMTVLLTAFGFFFWLINRVEGGWNLGAYVWIYKYSIYKIILVFG